MQFQWNAQKNPTVDIVTKMCAEHIGCKGCQLFCETGTNLQGVNVVCDTAVMRIRNGETNA